MENSMNNKDATRMLGTRFVACGSPLGDMSVTTHSATETLRKTPGLHMDAPGCLKDTLDWFTDLADTSIWSLRTIFVLPDVSLSIRELYDNIAGAPLGASDHWIPGPQWL